MGRVFTPTVGQRRSSSLSDQEARFSPTVLSRILFKPRFDNFHLPFLGVLSVDEHEVNSIFKHALAKLVIAKMCSTITDDGTGAPKSGKEGFENLPKLLGRRWCGSACASTHFADSSDSHKPKESGIKDLFGGEICTMMSPGGSIVASSPRMSRASLRAHTADKFDPAQIIEQEGVHP
ncbi:hypothetical protein Tco_0097203 [Tanacetum coccineum]